MNPSIFSPKGYLKIILIPSVLGRGGGGGVLVVGCQGGIIFLGLVNATCLAAHCIEIKYRNMVIISFSPLTCVNQKPPKSTWIFEFLIVNFDCLPYLISWRFFLKIKLVDQDLDGDTIITLRHYDLRVIIKFDNIEKTTIQKKFN